jgi:cyclase
MSKKRIIACLVVRQGIVVQSLSFRHYLPVGRPEIAVRFLNDWGVDEIVLLDIDATPEGRIVDPELVRRVARHCQVPLAVGGGIRCVTDMRVLLQAGADKVCINSAAIENMSLIGEAASMFGDQCIIGSVDVRRIGAGEYEVYGRGGAMATGIDPLAHTARLAEAGVGEILLNAIDRDGTRQGYDFELIDLVAPALSMPVIVLGGAGRPEHLHAALARPHVSAAAAANIWHYTEHSVAVAKASLRAQGMDVRYDSLADYSSSMFFPADGRLEKRDEQVLEEMVFEFVPDEMI